MRHVAAAVGHYGDYSRPHSRRREQYQLRAGVWAVGSLCRTITQHEAQLPLRKRASAMQFLVTQLGEVVWGSAMDRALLSSYWLSIVTIPLSVAVCRPQFAMQNLTGCFDPQSNPLNIPFLWWTAGPGPLSNTVGPYECTWQMAYHSVPRS